MLLTLMENAPIPAVAAFTQVSENEGLGDVEKQTPRSTTADAPCDVTVPPSCTELMVTLEAAAVVTTGAGDLPSCVTLTVRGEPMAPVAVTVMIAVRVTNKGLSATVTVMVALPVPEALLSVAQLWFEAAVHGMDPPPLLRI